MRSHSYLLSAGDWTRSLLAPMAAACALAAGLHLAGALDLLPPARPMDDPDQTLLVYKSELSHSRHPAQVVLIGDSSCAAGVDVPQLQQLLPGHPPALNLGLILGLGLDAYTDALIDFLARNPGQVRLVVLLATPQLLGHADLSPVHQEFWQSLRRGAAPPDLPGHRFELASLAGVDLLRQRVVPHLLRVPLKGQTAYVYGFSSDFQRYLELHGGSMVDPRSFERPRHPGPLRYRLAAALEAPSRRLRRSLPAGVQLAAGLTPVPEGLVDAHDPADWTGLLLQWNEWLQADLLLTNAPPRLPDGLFATGGHLNARGQRYFTRVLASALAPALAPEALHPSR